MAMRTISFKLKNPFLWQICVLIGTVRHSIFCSATLKANPFFRQLVNTGLGFPGGSVVKNLPANAEDLLRDEFNP